MPQALLNIERVIFRLNVFEIFHEEIYNSKFLYRAVIEATVKILITAWNSNDEIQVETHIVKIVIVAQGVA